MNKANYEIRESARSAKVKLWEIAAALGISDVTFTKKMRFELPDADKEKILNIIRSIELQKQNSIEH